MLCDVDRAVLTFDPGMFTLGMFAIGVFDPGMFDRGMVSRWRTGWEVGFGCR